MIFFSAFLFRFEPFPMKLHSAHFRTKQKHSQSAQYKRQKPYREQKQTLSKIVVVFLHAEQLFGIIHIVKPQNMGRRDVVKCCIVA